MRRVFGKKSTELSKSSSGSKSWEENVRDVMLEPCETGDDPLGYRAVFYLTPEARFAAEESLEEKCFSVGASLLSQREQHIVRAGYKAPMTRKAIQLLKEMTGVALEEV